MIYSAPPTHVLFNNQSPDIIEVCPVTTMDLTSLKIPPEAASFQFVKEVPDAPPERASPLYFIAICAVAGAEWILRKRWGLK